MRYDVSLRALMGRINRKLAEGDKKLMASRGWRMRTAVGAYYVLNARLNGVFATHVDPEALARQLGVLKPYERVVEDGPRPAG